MIVALTLAVGPTTSRPSDTMSPSSVPFTITELLKVMVPVDVQVIGQYGSDDRLIDVRVHWQTILSFLTSPYLFL